MGVDLNKMPLVTVYIPTYNRINLLKRAINSVLAQTYCNYEIIVVDDNSNDGTQEYLKEIALENKKIRYFLKKENSGACVSRNIAISNAKGEFITGLDDDDYFLENRLQNFIDNISLLNHNIFIFSNMLFDKNGKLRKKSSFRPKIVEKKHLIYGNYIGNQIFCYTSSIKKIQGFDEDLKAWQDWDCWYRLLDNNKAVFLEYNDYVVDDNDRLRITTKNRKEKIMNVYNYLCLKYSFTNIDKKIFLVNFLGYRLNVNILNCIFFRKNDLKYILTIWFWVRVFNCIKFKIFS
ncbi:glycosyltransferase [Acinetobacter soli]|uniref:glycosyltransferase n=1 Tax=Acinetobacter soli TaxID=487316 RepID=UPI001ABC8938|nr:glycosyltransferase [Acinetobacter soli]MBO3672640.1 glycosyltransferase [Acinetobacter soli]